MLQQVTSTSVNGGIHAEPKVGNRDRERTRVGSAESERESLLTQENTPKQLLKHKQLYTCINEQQQHICGQSSLAGGSGGGGTTGGSGGPAGGAGGCESDTNSNCALLVEDNNGPSLLSAANTAGTTKTINGNNNYELCEFDAKVPTYSNSTSIPNSNSCLNRSLKSETFHHTDDCYNFQHKLPPKFQHIYPPLFLSSFSPVLFEIQMHPLEQVRPAPTGQPGPATTLSGSVIPSVALMTQTLHPNAGSQHPPNAPEAFTHDHSRHQHHPYRQEVVAPMAPRRAFHSKLFGDRWRKSRPNATRPGQQPTANESLDDTDGPQPVRPGSGSLRMTATTSTSTTTTTHGSTAATSGSSVSGPGPGGGPTSTGGSAASVKCTVVNRLHSITADLEGAGTSCSSKKRPQRSRITYDREQGVRFYRGTETTDSNDCDCEDI
uniref:Uncharacterized protein n=1 Tax=Anopheles culicifacies TaxID=139723 RepID=A0A182M3H5_9DIPT